MQARPRSVENRVAEALSEHYQRLGLPAVDRIPVLGRTGPDITFHPELPLIVDVKSRQGVPKQLFFPILGPFTFDNMVAVRLSCLSMLWDREGHTAYLDYAYKTVRDWLEHMDEWTREEQPEGISCIVLHRPETPIGNCVAVISQTNRRRLFDYAERQYHHQLSLTSE